MIQRISSKIRPSKEGGIFHNSRQDVHTLSKVCNLLIDKVNELTDKVNELEGKLDK